MYTRIVVDVKSTDDNEPQTVQELAYILERVADRIRPGVALHGTVADSYGNAAMATFEVEDFE